MTWGQEPAPSRLVRQLKRHESKTRRQSKTTRLSAMLSPFCVILRLSRSDLLLESMQMEFIEERLPTFHSTRQYGSPCTSSTTLTYHSAIQSGRSEVTAAAQRH